MKHLYLFLSFFILATTQAQTTQVSICLWKAEALWENRSISADLDSITFKRPVVNLPQVTICSQVWATKNLDVTTYSDGTVIPQVTDPMAWANLITGAWCYITTTTPQTEQFMARYTIGMQPQVFMTLLL